ncbi:MAG TPA: hydrogenase maturation nickel metallochaperone HypA [Thiotrichales bacterium]|nr:hydrogenase maturation nickel metallochaperone HypA [Thiotrichales bacterium]
MHELAVSQSLLREVQRVAREHAAVSVSRVLVQIGPLSGVEPSLLREAFPLAAAGTLAEGAELVIETVPLRVRCETCGAESEARPNRLLCGACGDWHTRLLSGDELLLASVELERQTEEARHV